MTSDIKLKTPKFIKTKCVKCGEETDWNEILGNKPLCSKHWDEQSELYNNSNERKLSWAKRNPKKKNAIVKKYYYRNKDNIAKQKHDYYLKNKDKKESK